MPCHTDTIDTGPEYEALLCYVSTNYSIGKPWREVLEGNREFREWWASHKSRDRARLREEASALAKLTPEERNLLGFNGEGDATNAGKR